MDKIDELYHHGILGMKWGVRRYQNEDGTLTLTEAGKKKYAENYTTSQRARDRAVYSRSAVQRINKSMLEGQGIQTARASEADRIERYRTAAKNVKRSGKAIGGSIGAIGGSLLSSKAVDAVSKFINRPVMVDTPINRFIGEHKATINKGLRWLNNDMQGSVVRTALGSGIGAVMLGSVIPEAASRGVMRIGGYKPEKRDR